ncbi:xylulose kinase [Marinitoga sp. 1135]|uniref:xylulokinase n=1 Tax=Marinitoga sp. 1135 TaxID=1643333 RepID=UPI0015860E2A|nr:xylulokinase [Marinitoga sp. 1135]NUU95568.1 xylulose kinase [Marinitoga sp. 1135]
MILGIDLGTTGIKGIIVNYEGKVLKKTYRKLNIESPRLGWMEQNPREWWEKTKDIIKELTKEYEIETLSISGQMHSLVLLDEKDNLLYNAILWNDQRTKKESYYATKILGGIDNVIKELGNPILTGFTLPKLLWIKENHIDIYKKINKIFLPKDYISYMLTGIHVSEYSDISGTAMYDIRNRKWSEIILKKFNINNKILPKIINSGKVIGVVQKNIADELKLKNTLVVSGGADNACAALGIGVVRNEIMISLGTSGTVLKPVKNGIPDKRIHLFEHVIPKTKYYMGVMLSATHTFDWFKKNFISENITFDEINKYISNIPLGSNGVIFLPYLNGERTPHNNPNAKGIIFGLTTFNTKWDIIKAIYEGVAFGLKDSIEIIKSFGYEINEIIVTGGGSKSYIWINILSDIIGFPIKKSKINEGAAYGAAILAYAGLTNSNPYEIAKKWIKYTEPILYNKENFEKYKNIYSKYKKLYLQTKELLN